MASREYFTTVPTLSHEIDTFALEKFYDAINIPTLKPIVKKIIDNTKYVSFEEFKQQLELNVVEYYNEYKNFHKTGRPIFIYSTKGKDVPGGVLKSNIQYKSNDWCFNFVFNKMTELAKKDKISVESIFDITNNNTRLMDDDIIIFTDDCVYSGQPIGSLINTYAVYKHKYKFYVLVPYASENGIENIIDNYNRAEPRQKTGGVKRSRSAEKRLFFSNYIEIPHISNHLSEDEIESMHTIYAKEFFNKDTYLVYFNHKLAGNFAVPTLVYLGVVPNQKNHDILNSDEFEGFTTQSDKLEIIPIIKNCSHYKDKISIKSPTCPYPYPPYEEGFTQLSMKGGKRILKSYK
jgi:hypothetical protein